MSKRVSNDHSPATGNNSGFASAKEEPRSFDPDLLSVILQRQVSEKWNFPFWNDAVPFFHRGYRWIRFHWFRNLLFFLFFFFLKVKTRLRCFQVNVEIVLWNYHCMQEDNGGIVFLFFQFLSRLRSSLFLFFFLSSLRIWNGKFVEKNILAMGIYCTNLEL